MAKPADPVRKQIAKLRRQYAAELPRKVARVEDLVEAFLSSPWQEEACRTAYRQIHSLAGSAGTYGFKGIGTTARSGELLLKRSLEGRGAPGPAERRKLTGILAALKRRAAAANGTSTSSEEGR